MDIISKIKIKLKIFEFEFCIDGFYVFKGELTCSGWCFHKKNKPVNISIQFPGKRKEEVSYTPLESPDVAAIHGPRAEKCRFDFTFPVHEGYSDSQYEKIKIIFSSGGESFVINDPLKNTPLQYWINEFFVFRRILFCKGWVFDKKNRPVEISIRLPDAKEVKIDHAPLASSDTSGTHRPMADKCRFEFHLPLKEDYSPKDYEKMKLVFSVDDKELILDNPLEKFIARDEFLHSGKIFLDEVANKPGCNVLELGARARSGIIRQDMLADNVNYVGFDILPGENVDVAGDAHRLSSYFPKNKFDFVFSISTFEHLLMPWLVALEINKVMKTGGLIMMNTHQSWPIHDNPWDYFRFSKYSWHALFNKYTGFEIIEAAMGEECFYAPNSCLERFQGLDGSVGYLSTRCVARKTGDTDMQWPADPGELVKTLYPK